MRKTYFSHISFQVSYVLIFMSSVAVMALILSSLGYLALSIFAEDPMNLPTQSAALLSYSAYFLRFAIWIALPFIVGTGVFAGYLSFRKVGPLSRLEVWLVGIRAGQENKPFSIRPKDHLKPMVDLMNKVILRKIKK